MSGLSRSCIAIERGRGDKQLGSKSDLARAFYGISRIHRARGDLEKSLGYASRSWQIRKDLGEQGHLAHSFLQLADLESPQGKLLEAFQNCQKGHDLFDKLGNPQGRAAARELQALVFLQVGLLEESTELLQR